MALATHYDPRLVYAESLQAKGILVGRTFNRHGLVAMPQVMPAAQPENRIPICVEYLDDDELKGAFSNAWVEVKSIESELDTVFRKAVYSAKRGSTNLAGASIGLATAYGLHHVAPASEKSLSYVIGTFALASAGIAAFWWKKHGRELSNRQDLLMSFDIALGNFALCFKETQRRGIAPVSLVQTPAMTI